MVNSPAKSGFLARFHVLSDISARPAASFDNILFGGIGADTFVFDTADGGTQVIADMEAW